jgi:AraC-like DNA-binding protein
MQPLHATTLGLPVSAAHTPDFTLTEVQHSPGDGYAPHSHDRAYLLLVLTGSFREEACGGSAELTSGGVVAMPAGCGHRDRIGHMGARTLLVTLERSFDPIPGWRCVNGGPISQSMVALYRAFRDGEMLAAEEILRDSSVPPEVTVRRTPDRRCIRVAVEVLHTMSDQPLRFAEVARAARVTPAYLSRAFRQCFGRTMGSYLRELRARRAASLLAATNEPLAAVALASGFADQGHLCRVFRAQYGATPAGYRRLMRRSTPFNT